MTDSRKTLGDSGEAVAAHALEKAGLTISPEIGVARQANSTLWPRSWHLTSAMAAMFVPWLVVVEVRTRRGTRYGSALQSITPRKQRKLTRGRPATTFKPWTGRGPWRIDVVAVQT